MIAKRSRRWLAPVAVVACLLVQPVAGVAQCMVMSTTMLISSMTTVVAKNLSAAGMCTQTMAMNAFCFPNPSPMTTVVLGASNIGPLTNPSCGWKCTCGGVTSFFVTDGSDGLPVELMEFSVEDAEGEPDGEGTKDAEATATSADDADGGSRS